ncbi:MAG: hypothetical protein ACE5EX_03180, partial [Phycisphaerae bacterium]
MAGPTNPRRRSGWRPRTVGRAVGLLCMLCVAVPRAIAQTPADRFVKNLDDDASIPAEAKEMIRRTWSRCDHCDGNEFITQALAVFSPPFRAGLDAYEAEAYDKCASTMEPLAHHANPFLATYAAAYEIKSLVAMEKLLEAGQRLEERLKDSAVADSDFAEYSYFAPEMTFLRGLCLVSDLQYDAGGEALAVFLKTYPTASERLRIVAQQMIAELQTRQPEQIGEVCDLMVFAGRRLTHGDLGD